MAKPHIQRDKTAGLLRDAIQTTGWVLCIGAGTSVPLFPSWAVLVTRLLAREHPGDSATLLSNSLLRQFSPDALIQAAANRSDSRSVEALSEDLYSDISSRLSPREWRTVAGVLACPGKQAISDKAWRGFLDLVRGKLPPTPALGLAELLADVVGTDCQPDAVLSFNAEALLVALVNAITWERATDGGRRSPKKDTNRERLDLVTRSISGRKVGRVPFVFCHGLLPVPGQKRIADMIAVDKLVFSEGDYLQLANNAYSWQASAFLDACASRRVLFLGVSLSDPDMRRWLCWTHANRLRELETVNEGDSGPSTFHYWLRRKPENADEMPWIEAAVQHLGVRLVWVDHWDESVETIRSMLRLPHAT